METWTMSHPATSRRDKNNVFPNPIYRLSQARPVPQYCRDTNDQNPAYKPKLALSHNKHKKLGERPGLGDTMCM